MRAVDTNIITRFLTQDDPGQFILAKRLFDRDQLFVSVTVILETEWVLRSVFRFSPDRIIEAFRLVAGLSNVTIEDETLLSAALSLTENGADFADALHVTRSSECEDFVTFERDLLPKDADRNFVTVTRLVE